MTPSALKQYILSKPENSDIRLNYDMGADGSVAELLNEEEILGDPKPMRISAFATFLAGIGKLIPICKLKDDTNLADTHPIKNISFLIFMLITGASDREIDPNDPGTISMLEALVTAQVVTEQDHTAWLNACKQPIRFSPDDVAKARNS